MMIGVVLWSHPQERKAVIWCEDHGELAFYNCDASSGCKEPVLDAGDLIAFDVNTHQSCRVALNPKLLEEGYFEGLPQVLGSKKMPQKDAANGNNADIIPLSMVLAKKGPVRTNGPKKRTANCL